MPIDLSSLSLYLKGITRFYQSFKRVLGGEQGARCWLRVGQGVLGGYRVERGRLESSVVLDGKGRQATGPPDKRSILSSEWTGVKLLGLTGGRMA